MTMTAQKHPTLLSLPYGEGRASHNNQRKEEDAALTDQAVIEALQRYLRQSALMQRTHLPRWASW